MKQITDVISLSLPKDQVYKIVQVAASTKIHTSEEATTPKQGSSLAGDYLSLQPENVVIEESMKIHLTKYSTYLISVYFCLLETYDILLSSITTIE